VLIFAATPVHDVSGWNSTPESTATENVVVSYEPKPHEWRRTTKGWEQAGFWFPANRTKPENSRLFHPSLLAAIQLLVSYGALLLAEPDKKTE